MEWPLGQFNFNSDVVCRTSFHIWGRWYFPMFLFRDGSLTLINRASLIALVRFWSSLPTIVKLLMLMLWPEMLQWSNIGKGPSDFFEPFCKISSRFTKVFFFTPMLTAFKSVYDSTFICYRILVLGSHEEVSYCLTSFEEHLNPKLLHDLLILSLSPWLYGTTMYKFVLFFWPVWLVLLVLMLLEFWLLILALFTQTWGTHKAHNLKQGICHIWNNQRAGQHHQAPSRKIPSSCSEQQRLPWKHQRYRAATRWVHHVLWCECTIYIHTHDPAIKTIEKHLEEDQDLSKRTSMTVEHIISLLEFCLRNTYFSFQGRYYEQTEGAAMGWSNKPTVANLFMEEFEKQAISTSTTPPVLWKRFVDDTFTIIKKNNKDSFLEHLNSINPKIQFTCEETREDGSMPFLDILVTPRDNGSLTTSVFRKTTHTDLYLQWDSHHTIPSKYSAAGTLFHRASTVCSTPNCCKKKKNTFSELSQDVNTHMGHKKGQNEKPEL